MEERYRKLYVNDKYQICYEDENTEIIDSNSIDAFDHDVDKDYIIKCDQSYGRSNRW